MSFIRLALVRHRPVSAFANVNPIKSRAELANCHGQREAANILHAPRFIRDERNSVVQKSTASTVSLSVSFVAVLMSMFREL